MILQFWSFETVFESLIQIQLYFQAQDSEVSTMQLARILLVMTALAVIDSEARWFSFPITFPASFSSLLPFTFNVTTDGTDRGSVTLNIKPKFNREVRKSVNLIGIFKKTVTNLNLILDRWSKGETRSFSCNSREIGSS